MSLRGFRAEETPDAKFAERRDSLVQRIRQPDSDRELGAGSGTDRLVAERVNSAFDNPYFMQTDCAGGADDRSEISGIGNAVEKQGERIGQRSVGGEKIRLLRQNQNPLRVHGRRKRIELRAVEHNGFVVGRVDAVRHVFAENTAINQIRTQRQNFIDAAETFNHAEAAVFPAVTSRQSAEQRLSAL